MTRRSHWDWYRAAIAVVGCVVLTGVLAVSAACAPGGVGATTSNGKVSPEYPVHVHAAPKPLPAGAVTSDWPRFLGPTHNGISSETKLLKRFPATGPTLLWEVETGRGYASPAVAGDRLVYFHRVDDEEVVECRSAETGALLWHFSYPTAYRDRYGFNDGPRCGPIIDGEHVYTYGAEGKLHCLDLAAGKLLWQKHPTVEFGAPQEYFGVGTTPLVEGDRLIVNVGGRGGPCVVGFEKRTGELVWKAGDQWGASYASPIPATVNGQRRVFVFSGGDSRPPTGGLLAINPASGAIHGRFPFRSKKYESVNAASPVVVGDQVFLTTSYDTGGVMLNVLPEGDFEMAWKSDALRAHFATPIHRDGHLYSFDGMNKSDTAIVCVDAITGRQVWREQPEWEDTLTAGGRQRTVSLGTFRGSMIFADGHFLCLGEMGHLLWLDLSPAGYKELSRTRLFYAEESWTPLVLSRGLLYVTQNNKDVTTGEGPRLLCYDLRGS